MDFIQSLLPTIGNFHIIGYIIALLIALFETLIGVGLFLPGSTILLFMGAMAFNGYFDLEDLLLFAIAGAVIGDNINYLIGKKYGSKIFTNGFWIIKPSHFKKGEEFFKQHGPKSIFFGRLVPSIKEVIPLVAGTFGMKRLSFMMWNILGAIVWSVIWILPGYFFAQSLDLAKIWLTRVGFFIAIAIVIFGIFYILKIIFIKKGKSFFKVLSSAFISIKCAISENREVQKFTQKHKVFFVFIKNRFNKNKFFGLPLTLLSVALLYVFSLLGGVIEDLITSDIIVYTDVRFDSLLAVFRNNELTHFFLWVTLLGKWQIIFIFTIAVTLILWIQKKRYYIAPLFLSIVGSSFFTYIGKILFHRPRPELAVYIERSFSFPSGHATIAVAFYGFLAYILLKNTEQWKTKVNIFFTVCALIILIGFSRLYLGVHYLSDVWGGYLVGFIWLIVAISLSEYFLYKKVRQQSIQMQKRKFTTISILIASIILYVIFAIQYQIPVSTPAKETSKITVSNITTIFKTKQLKYNETLFGNKKEPISFVVLAKGDKQLITVFNKAGWYLSDDLGIANVAKTIKNSLLKKTYSNAPMTPSFWNTNIYNFGFEKVINFNNNQTRYYARFWKTKYITKNGYSIYVGTSNFSSGVKWRIIRKINPDLNKSREFTLNDLKKAGEIVNIRKIQFVKPKVADIFSDDSSFTNGNLYLFEIK